MNSAQRDYNKNLSQYIAKDGLSSDDSKWRNTIAYKKALELVKTLGNPNVSDISRGGVAIWRNVPRDFSKRNSTKNYLELIIRDEAIPHIIPAPHLDWLYLTVEVNIPEGKIKEVLKLTDSIFYDKMSGRLTARCHYIAANIATLSLGIQIARGYKSLSTARQEYVILLPLMIKEELNGGGYKSGAKTGLTKIMESIIFS